MPLTPEQISQLRNQLSEQIKHLPEAQKKEAENQIDKCINKPKVTEAFKAQLSLFP